MKRLFPFWTTLENITFVVAAILDIGEMNQPKFIENNRVK